MKKVFLAAVFILGGCVSTAPLSGNALVEKGETLKTDHHVVFTSDDNHQNLRTHLEISHDEVVLIGLGMLGETLFECQSRAQKLKCSKISSAFPAERLFKDIQHIIWTADEKERFTSELIYENKYAGYHLTLKPLNFERGKS